MHTASLISLHTGGYPHIQARKADVSPGMRRTFAITALALFMFSLDRTVVLTALPDIGADLGAGLNGLQWTVNAYTLTFAVLVVTGAALGDRFGRRRMLVVGLALFTLGSGAAALSHSVGTLV